MSQLLKIKRFWRARFESLKPLLYKCLIKHKDPGIDVSGLCVVEQDFKRLTNGCVAICDFCKCSLSISIKINSPDNWCFVRQLRLQAQMHWFLLTAALPGCCCIWLTLTQFSALTTGRHKIKCTINSIMVITLLNEKRLYHSANT